MSRLNRLLSVLVCSVLVCVVSLFASRTGRGGESTLRRIQLTTVPGVSAAVVVDRRALIHTAQLLPRASDGDLADQTVSQQGSHLLEQLERLLSAYDCAREDIVKIDFYLANVAVRDAVDSLMTEWCEAGKVPAVSYVVTRLPRPGAKVSLDAVIAARQNVDADLPERRAIEEMEGDARQADACLAPRGDAVYIAGQAARKGDMAEATQATLRGLLRTLEHLGLSQRNIVRLKCFLQPIDHIEIVNRQITKELAGPVAPPVSYVEWISDSYPIEIELIAYAPASDSDTTVSYATPPWMKSSPVYSRVARIHGDRRIYTSGLYGRPNGSGETQVRDIFRSLEAILAAAGSDVHHLAKATYFVSNDDASKKLNEVRPSIYDPDRPPAASKAMTRGVGDRERSVTIDMIAAPR